MIADLGPSLGFLSAPIPNGGTYTLTTYLGVFLRRAEEVAGRRDLDWTILGVEFFGKEDEGAAPHTWYPGGCGNVAIRLTRDVALDPQRALFQLAHEACHLISPSGHTGKAPNLEEGFATVLGHELAEEHANFRCPVSAGYKKAHDAVESLLRSRPTAIRDMRAIEPKLWLITPQIVAQVVPGIESGLADFLCAAWKKG
ncbi:hypothetical protein [Bradyrhizobium liaoningense]|uniref:hypothetical protein n=1 Tax=Bradyrhizobium liaoningense TaxID=43992 RepID=UPI001BA82C16|nr:hypothetical protein [Bradyrhizobium liaoningense]MBR1071220.1 hypothetical protein [Bradyrhizobium liaoningense]